MYVGGEELVVVAHATGRAAVVRDDPVLRLLVDGALGGIVTITEYRPAIVPANEQQVVLAGRLPPGATGAEVRRDDGTRVPAVTAAGVWLAVAGRSLYGSSPVVRCHDPHGTTVRRPIPHVATITAVEDATEPCPACDALDWGRLQPPETPRKEPLEGPAYTSPTVRIFCLACGHQEPTTMTVGGESGEWRTVRWEDQPKGLRSYLTKQAEARRHALQTTALLVHAVRGAPDRHLDCEVVNDCAVSVRVVHQLPDVGGNGIVIVDSRMTTDPPSDPQLVLRDALAAIRESDPPPVGRSQAAQLLWQRYRRKPEISTGTRAKIRIDGEAHVFALARSGDWWAAVRSANTTITLIVATGISANAIELELLTDPACELEDRPG